MTWGTENKVKKSRFYILQLMQLSQLFLFNSYQELIFQPRYINPTFLFRISSQNFPKYCFVPVETYSFKWPSNFGQAFNRTVWNPGRQRKVSIRKIKKKEWVHTVLKVHRDFFYHEISPSEKIWTLIYIASFYSKHLNFPYFGGFGLFSPPPWEVFLF